MDTQKAVLVPKQIAVKKLNSEALIQKRLELTAIAKEAEEVLAYINSELHIRILKEGDNKKLKIGAHSATLVERAVYKDVDIQVGAKLNALKTVLDTTKLNEFLKEEMKAKKIASLSELVKKGTKVKGVQVSEYVLVR